jgi:nitrite reductase/ring-hydroxylating ferredoxin subunit
MTGPPNATAQTRITLCRTTDVAEGTVIRVEQGDLILAVYNVGCEFFVTDDMCTHGPGLLSEGYLEDDVIECNFHGGQFNVRTGAVVGPPCMVPIKTYKVVIDGENIAIEI